MPRKPPDLTAAELAVALEAVRQRIVTGPLRSIEVPTEWLPTVVGCDRELATLDADYEIHQIKTDRLGDFCFYAQPVIPTIPARVWTDVIDAWADVAATVRWRLRSSDTPAPRSPHA